jgi:hypothetical protein
VVQPSPHVPGSSPTDGDGRPRRAGAECPAAPFPQVGRPVGTPSGGPGGRRAWSQHRRPRAPGRRAGRVEGELPGAAPARVPSIRSPVRLPGGPHPGGAAPRHDRTGPRGAFVRRGPVLHRRPEGGECTATLRTVLRAPFGLPQHRRSHSDLAVPQHARRAGHGPERAHHGALERVGRRRRTPTGRPISGTLR